MFPQTSCPFILLQCQKNIYDKLKLIHNSAAFVVFTVFYNCPLYLHRTFTQMGTCHSSLPPSLFSGHLQFSHASGLTCSFCMFHRMDTALVVVLGFFQYSALNPSCYCMLVLRLIVIEYPWIEKLLVWFKWEIPIPDSCMWNPC